MPKNIIIIGSRGFEYNYGGWETFVTNLIYNYRDKNTKFYVPSLTNNKEDNEKIIIKKDVVCPQIYVPDQGFVTMFTFTIKATKYFQKYLKKNQLKNCIVYFLGCKIGPLLSIWQKTFHKMGVKVIMNPDGLEWTRDKWPWWIKQCFKFSERTMIKASDYIVCDSKSIEHYVQEKYHKYQPKTTFIAYGAYLKKAKPSIEAKQIFKKNDIKEKEYFLIVGRFIPENNYETIIKEFMKTNITKDLVIICNLEHNKFYNQLEQNTNFTKDKRIKFLGAIYDENILNYIRSNAYAYLHGHSAGGTNPSLLEALSLTNINILYKVSYNEEVGLDNCFYFTKEENNLKNLLEKIVLLPLVDQKKYGQLAKKRIKTAYTWDIVQNQYQNLFNKLLK